MITTRGRLLGASRGLNGEAMITLEVGEEVLAEIDSVKDKELSIEIKQYRKGRSLNANAYFWKLCTEIARKIGADKEDVYLMELKAGGEYRMFEGTDESVEQLKKDYKLVEIEYRFPVTATMPDGYDHIIQMAGGKAYIGSSHYDSKQMATLIDYAVRDAIDLGIKVWPKEEIDYLIENWTPR